MVLSILVTCLFVVVAVVSASSLVDSGLKARDAVRGLARERTLLDAGLVAELDFRALAQADRVGRSTAPSVRPPSPRLRSPVRSPYYARSDRARLCASGVA